MTNAGTSTLLSIIKERKFIFISRVEDSRHAAAAANPDNIKEKQTSYTRKLFT